jgi:hypothetical protein
MQGIVHAGVATANVRNHLVDPLQRHEPQPFSASRGGLGIPPGLPLCANPIGVRYLGWITFRLRLLAVMSQQAVRACHSNLSQLVTVKAHRTWSDPSGRFPPRAKSFYPQAF